MHISMVHRLSLRQYKFYTKLQLPSEELLDQLQNLDQQRHRLPSRRSDRSSDIQARNSFRHRPQVKTARTDLTCQVQPQLDYKFVEVYDEVNLY